MKFISICKKCGKWTLFPFEDGYCDSHAIDIIVEREFSKYEFKDGQFVRK